MYKPETPENPVPEAEASQPAQKTSKSSPVAWLLVIAILIILAVGVGIYLWERMGHNTRAMITTQAQLTQQADKITQLASGLSDQTQTIVDQKQLIADDRATIARVMSALGSHQDIWLTSEAGHLIRLANVTLKFEHNVPATIVLLQSADERLYQAKDPDLYSVREIIANDIATLQALPKIDVVGIYLQLQALRNQSTHLSLVENRFSGDAGENVLAQTQANGGFWHNAWHQTSYALSKVLVIRHREQPIDPLITPKEHLVLSQNIYLLFSQAQWAVLHRNTKIYQASLDQLTQWLSHYFVANTLSVQMVKTLNQLKAKTIALTLPDISNTLDALKAYHKLKQKKSLLKVSKPKSPAKTEQGQHAS